MKIIRPTAPRLVLASFQFMFMNRFLVVFSIYKFFMNVFNADAIKALPVAFG
jgi:hypothetical protein